MTKHEQIVLPFESEIGDILSNKILVQIDDDLAEDLQIVLSDKLWTTLYWGIELQVRICFDETEYYDET